MMTTEERINEYQGFLATAERMLKESLLREKQKDDLISELSHEASENRKWNSECPNCRDRKKDVEYAIERLREIVELTTASSKAGDNARAALMKLTCKHGGK